MRGQQFADFLNRLDDSATEFLALKMRAHSFHNTPPEFLAAFLMNRFVADNREFVRSRRYENQHRIALTGLVHSEPLKFLLRNDQRIDRQFAALDINANLARAL